MNCQYCHNTFSSKHGLRTHQRRAKYCLKIQGVEKSDIKPDVYVCEYCSSEMGSDKKNRHLKACKSKLYREGANYVKTIKELKAIIIEKDKLIAELRVYKTLAEKNQTCIEEIAKQPRIQQNTQTNNNLLTLTPFDLDQKKFSKVINDHFTKDYMLDGQKGVARFAVDKLLRDQDGNLQYVCTDPSRQIYRFKTNEGDIERDIKAKKLTNVIIEDVVKRSHNIASTNIDTEQDPDIFLVYSGQFQDISDMTQDNGEFRSELASLTSV